jgi:hypothetical protein
MLLVVVGRGREMVRLRVEAVVCSALESLPRMDTATTMAMITTSTVAAACMVVVML